jgi:hypothetical protein
MRNYFFICFLFASIFTCAQEMEIGSNYLKIGIGPSTHFEPYMNSSPALKLSLEHGFKEIGPGILTIGGSLGLFNSHRTVTWNYEKMTTRFSVISIQPRATWYYNMEPFNVKQLNLYTALGLGFRFESYNTKYSLSTIYNNSDTKLFFHLSFIGGANYYITPRVALFLEFGYDVSYTTLGVSIQL